VGGHEWSASHPWPLYLQRECCGTQRWEDGWYLEPVWILWEREDVLLLEIKQYFPCCPVSALTVVTELCWLQINWIMRADTYMVHTCYKT